MPYWIHSAPDDLDDGLRECARAGRCSDARLEVVAGKTVRRGAFTPRAYCDSCRGIFDGAKCRQCGVVYTAQEYRDLVAATGDMIRRAGVRRRSLAAPGSFDDIEARRA
ncbi:hypothetical protein OG884_33715 [Streptosporangium sp. NBC_01755]|uniref:hypothetical protein n=1 Tax=unclassified Streptosporangium TaxID=2632669 RepID=UPI002DD8CE05|nr:MULTISPECIES: hypothetical protein [unclassified Streptosporangium]WSA28847.1 hypothetical protein OIE13_13770 [Streptosporangium sp. NBC_01810]WSC99707.1 hypothetical protein OG884_33715 [Streptosporangium sp. NBC_01755]